MWLKKKFKLEPNFKKEQLKQKKSKFKKKT